MEDGLPEIRPGQSYLSGLCVLPDLSARPGLSDLPELFVLPGPADMGRSRAEGRIIGRDGGRVSRSVRRFSRPSMGQRRATVACPAGRTARCADGSFSASAVCCGWCTDCSIRFCRFLSVGITGRFCFVRLQGACRFVFVRPYRPVCGLSVSSMAGRSGRCGKVRSGADCPWGCAGVCVSAPTGPSTSAALTCISASAGRTARCADGSFSASAGRVSRYACCPVPLRRAVPPGVRMARFQLRQAVSPGTRVARFRSGGPCRPVRVLPGSAPAGCADRSRAGVFAACSVFPATACTRSGRDCVIFRIFGSALGIPSRQT